MHLVKLDQSISPPLLTTASSLDPSQETVQRRSEIDLMGTKINDRFGGKKQLVTPATQTYPRPACLCMSRTEK